jgi:two-component system, cell cycle response regulator
MTTDEQADSIYTHFERPGRSCERVLVAEDDPMFRHILKSWLENWGYHVTLAEDGGKAWEILHQDIPPQLLILDWIMPGVHGPELCRMVREEKRVPYQYILLATAKDAKRDLVIGLEAGADDYLTKPFDKAELRARLRAGNRILTLQDEQMKAHEQLRFQATHDPLTSIWNRGEILEMLRRELERGSRSHACTGLLLLDVDHFKSINDTHGHLTGDEVLKEVTRRITKAVRTYDSLGRYGGEEFLVLLPGCSRDQTDHGAERVRAAVDNGPIVVNDAEVFVTVSIGAAVTNGTTSAEEVLAAADIALYRAKIVRNRTVLTDLAFK